MRMRKQNSKTTIPLDVVPERVPNDCPRALIVFHAVRCGDYWLQNRWRLRMRIAENMLIK